MNAYPIDDPQVAAVFEQFPASTRDKLRALRQLVLDTAAEMGIQESLQEILKWGQPSYVCKTGSTIRMGGHKSNPNQYYLYFHCQTKLIETFKTLYANTLKFEGNRAIVLRTDESINCEVLQHCIELALNYHRIKHLPMLGV